jgi:hypothetical protein
MGNRIWRGLDVLLKVRQPSLADTGHEIHDAGEQRQAGGGVDVVGGRGQLSFRQGNQLPGEEIAHPVGDKNKQEQGANVGHPGPEVFLTNLGTGNALDKLQGVLDKVLQTSGLPLQLTSPQQHHGQDQGDGNPTGNQNLPVNRKFAQVPVKVMTNLKFCYQRRSGEEQVHEHHAEEDKRVKV